ncbi:hypothetical protein, partial [Nocardiopsis sp. TNDT3]|uniref:hypothetical protein n=1 Tax=Nocardiopsis sp. TNDT3 TaxID=2249354 RepID=UPI001E3C62BA
MEFAQWWDSRVLFGKSSFPPRSIRRRASNQGSTRRRRSAARPSTRRMSETRPPSDSRALRTPGRKSHPTGPSSSP